MTKAIPPKRIVVAVDLSEPSLAALSAAAGLSARFGARLDVVFVEEPLNPLDIQEGVAASGIAALERRRKIFRLDWTQRVRAATEGLKPSPKLIIVSGSTVSQLLRYATHRRADLLVMGTHGRHGSARFFMSSVAEALVHRSEIPVLAIRENTPFDPQRILIPCHMQRYADEALLYGVEFAQALGAGVTALFVAGPETWELDAEVELQRHVEETLGLESARRVRIIGRSGEPREEIAQEADMGGYDLLVLSAHQRARLSDIVVGSTAERLLRRCRLPLLAVPTRQAAPLSRMLLHGVK